MLLPAQFDAALDAMGGCIQRGLDIAPPIDARAIFEAGIGGERRLDGQDRWLFGIIDPRQSCRPTRGQMAGGRHQKDRLSQIVNRPIAHQRFVMGCGRTIGDGVEIRPRQHQRHAGRRAHRRHVQRGDPPARDARQAKGQMQAIGRHGDIVDIARLTRHMEGRCIMGQ